jgi:glucose-6-phosphate 1-dehydrogenase
MQTLTKNTYYSDSFNYKDEGLIIIILGASGDLAKKKTYPSLFQLYCLDYLPKDFYIIGFARSKFTNIIFRENIKKYLRGNNEMINKFLDKCYYNKAIAYNDIESWKRCNNFSGQLEKTISSKTINRLFYFAIPSTQFRDSAYVIKTNAISTKGWNRFILEKPFGKNYDSYLKLANELSQIVTENDLYRIDHYLGKEMVQNLMVLRFSNIILSSVWNSTFIKHVIIQFKEDFGTEGRGGYFDDFGIIRDVIQNHLIQVLSLIAMEPPVCVEGKDHSTFIRDEKVKVLRCVS